MGFPTSAPPTISTVMLAREDITHGPYAGWTLWRGHHPNRFSELLGPYYFRTDEAGIVRCKMETGVQHMNGLGFLHGGFLMAFIDQVMFAVVRHRLSATVGAVTLSCDTHFLGSGRAGQVLDGTGEIMKETGKMLFVRGMLSQDGEPVCAYTGTLRKVTRKA